MREILLSSCVLIPVVLLLRVALGKRISMRLRYALWLLVAVRLLLPVQFGQSKLSVENVIERMPQSQPLVLEITPAEKEMGVPTQEILPTHEGISSKQLVHIIWYAGIAAMALWHLTVNAHFYYKARKGSKRLHLPDTRLRVFISEGVSSPCLFGSIIFLTPEIALSESKRTHVIAHEMTHFYHADSLWSIVRAVCLCVYWFHPLVWCAAILSKQDCELACDEGALRRLGETERYSYGKTLICVAAQASRTQNLLHTATTMSLSKKQLTERIKTIASKQKRPIAVVLVLCLLLSLTVACTFTGSAAETKQEQLSEPIEGTFADAVTTQRQATKVQEITSTMPSHPTQEPTEAETTPATKQMQHAMQTESPTTQEISVSPSVMNYTENYLGEFRVTMGDIVKVEVFLSCQTDASVSNSLVARVNLAAQDPRNGRCIMKIKAYQVGETNVFFENERGRYLAAKIVVYDPLNREPPQPSIVIPDFSIPIP